MIILNIWSGPNIFNIYSYRAPTSNWPLSQKSKTTKKYVILIFLFQIKNKSCVGHPSWGSLDVIFLSLYQSLYLASKQGADLEHHVPGVLLDGWSWLLQEAIDPSWRGSISTPGARPWTCWTHGRWQSPAARSRGDLQLCWWSRATLHDIVVDVHWPIISLKSENVHNWKRKWVRSVL